jgi:AraC-like DNA-binding protein
MGQEDAASPMRANEAAAAARPPAHITAHLASIPRPLLLDLDGQEIRVAPPAAEWRGARTSERQRVAIERFRVLVVLRLTDTISIPELCEKIGVPQRTLRAYCRQSLGMSPKRYIRMQRMRSARDALRVATQQKTSVTRIASALGFSNLGLFAVEYRALFGESPSSTLRIPPGAASRPCGTSLCDEPPAAANRIGPARADSYPDMAADR